VNVHPLTFRPDMMTALRRGAKIETRRLVGSGNTVVLPGKFEQCDMGTARVRTSRHGTLTEIRARCELPSGTRVVTIAPKVQPGDVFWTRKPRGRRKDSRITLLVMEVHARRVQDMTDQDALDEGIQHYAGGDGRPRDRFRSLWNDINGPTGWDQNDWVWVYRFQVRHGNVDNLYDLGEPSGRRARRRRQ
jgi:hypothetical protein